MDLKDEIRLLRDRVVAELNSAHDYYTDTKIAWQLVHKVTAAGHKFSVRNMVTETVTTQTELAVKARGYVAEQLAEATFQQFIALFESFFFDFLRLWLLAYPQSLGKKTVDFRDILDAPDKDAIAELVVRRAVDHVLYGPPAKWFAYLEEIAKPGWPSASEVLKFAEAKASRDVLVHNRGIANKTYTEKAGNLARFQPGDKVEIPEHYHRETWQLIRDLVAGIIGAVIAKLG